MHRLRVLLALLLSSMCPSQGHLQQMDTLDTMLRLRSNADRILCLLVYGPTSGKASIRMKDAGIRFIEQQVGRLHEFGLPHLVLTTWLHLPQHPQDNACSSHLRPRGICCGWSDVGIDLVSRPGQEWTVHPTHPYLLFLQRWWFTARATDRGYNILSLDSDLRLATNPLPLLASLPAFSLLMQADALWPVSDSSSEARSQHDSKNRTQRTFPVVYCERLGRHRNAGQKDRGCVSCGSTAPPMLNTGVVYARAHAAVTRVFNSTVEVILRRLQAAPLTDESGKVLVTRVWPQDVVNEVVAGLAQRPRLGLMGGGGGQAACHAMDAACQPLLHARHAHRRFKGAGHSADSTDRTCELDLNRQGPPDPTFAPRARGGEGRVQGP